MDDPPTEELRLLRQCLARTIEDLHKLVHHKDNGVPADLADPAREEPYQDDEKASAPDLTPKPVRRPARASRAERSDTLSAQLARLDRQLRLIALAVRAYADLAEAESIAAKDHAIEAETAQQKTDSVSDTELLALLTALAEAGTKKQLQSGPVSTQQPP